MKRFVARRVIKIPRYRLFYFLLFFSVLLLVFLNLVLTIFLKGIDGTSFFNFFVGNSYGNIIDSYSMKVSSKNYFYQNVFGFPFSYSQPVMEEKPNLEDPIIQSSPIIYLYNTFQTDKYQNPYYRSYSINPVVTQASFILQEDLKNLGINSLVEEKSVAKVLKDNNIAYSLSYRGSRILLEDAKQNYPTLNYFFDLGMSDDQKEVTTLSSNETTYARILFIVGTENANYAENQKLAISLNEKLDVLCNGLSRGVSLRGGAGYHGIYNQDFSNNALLIYVGGKENTIDEVNRSLKILAEVIYKQVKDDRS